MLEPEKPELTPAISVKKSVTPDYIVCLDDGKKFKSLKRHLRSHYGMSPEEYREKWGLARDYPMVAPAYAAARSHLAKSMGLGQRNGKKAGAESRTGGIFQACKNDGEGPSKAERGSSGRRSALAVSGAARVSGGLGRSAAVFITPGDILNLSTTTPNGRGRIGCDRVRVKCLIMQVNTPHPVLLPASTPWRACHFCWRASGAT